MVIVDCKLPNGVLLEERAVMAFDSKSAPPPTRLSLLPGINYVPRDAIERWAQRGCNLRITRTAAGNYVIEKK